MTVAERLMKYLTMNTKMHMDQRPRLVHKGDSTKINFEQMTDYRLEDEDGNKIELEELTDKYFSNPEDYFEKGFIEIEAENRAQPLCQGEEQANH